MLCQTRIPATCDTRRVVGDLQGFLGGSDNFSSHIYFEQMGICLIIHHDRSHCLRSGAAEPCAEYFQVVHTSLIRSTPWLLRAYANAGHALIIPDLPKPLM